MSYSNGDEIALFCCDWPRSVGSEPKVLLFVFTLTVDKSYYVFCVTDWPISLLWRKNGLSQKIVTDGSHSRKTVKIVLSFVTLAVWMHTNFKNLSKHLSVYTVHSEISSLAQKYASPKPISKPSNPGKHNGNILRVFGRLACIINWSVHDPRGCCWWAWLVIIFSSFTGRTLVLGKVLCFGVGWAYFSLIFMLHKTRL